MLITSSFGHIDSSPTTTMCIRTECFEEKRDIVSLGQSGG